MEMKQERDEAEKIINDLKKLGIKDDTLKSTAIMMVEYLIEETRKTFYYRVLSYIQNNY